MCAASRASRPDPVRIERRQPASRPAPTRPGPARPAQTDPKLIHSRIFQFRPAHFRAPDLAQAPRGPPAARRGQGAQPPGNRGPRGQIITDLLPENRSISVYTCSICCWQHTQNPADSHEHQMYLPTHTNIRGQRCVAAWQSGTVGRTSDHTVCSHMTTCGECKGDHVWGLGDGCE